MQNQTQNLQGSLQKMHANNLKQRGDSLHLNVSNTRSVKEYSADSDLLLTIGTVKIDLHNKYSDKF
jgi:hypothetical protein